MDSLFKAVHGREDQSAQKALGKCMEVCEKIDTYLAVYDYDDPVEELLKCKKECVKAFKGK